MTQDSTEHGASSPPLPDTTRSASNLSPTGGTGSAGNPSSPDGTGSAGSPSLPDGSGSAGDPMPPAEEQAARFARQREQDRTALAEDYVELIADLLKVEGEARAVDIARRMGVSQATVAATVGRLQRDGLVETRPYRGLFLSEEGRALATAAKQRHELVVRFLMALGLDAETAETDAEGLEHHASQATLDAFARFLAGGQGGR